MPRLLLLALPVVASLLAFADTMPGDFIYDDVLLIKNGVRLKEFDLQRIFLDGYWSSERADRNYRPLTLLTYALNHRVSPDPWGFHLVNGLLNAGVALVVALLLAEILGSLPVAAMCAAVYAVLPVHTEAVSNVVGRAEILAALSIFAAWLVALRGLGPDGRERWMSAAAVGTIVFLGLLSKENAIVAPAVLLLSFLTPRRRIPWKAFAISCLAALVYLLVRAVVLGSRTAVVTFIDNPLRFSDPLTRFLNAGRLLGLYVLKIVFPVHLSADYSYDQIPVLGTGDPVLWLSFLAVAGGLALLIGLSWKRVPACALAGLFFLVAFAPTSNLVFPIGTIFGERLAYAPSLAYPIILGAVALVPPLRRRLPALGVILGLLVVAYGARTWARNRDWASEDAMYTRMCLDAPRSAKSHLKAAEHYVAEWLEAPPGKQKEELLALAKEATARSLEIYPEHGMALANRGKILLYEGRYAEAAEQLTAAGRALIEQQSFQPPIYLLRGQSYLRSGKLAEAEEDLTRYIDALSRASSPKDDLGYNYRGLARALQGKMRAALDDFTTAVSLRADRPEVWNNLAMCRKSLDDLPGAIRAWETALALVRAKPSDEPEAAPARLLEKLSDAWGRVAEARRGAGDAAGAQEALAESGRYRALLEKERARG